ncbi:hypothetical protein CRENBAI_011332 [Crenichthys baileyi]|uniref:Uncharacterized protein n=1 Tax=Crenichthys baileyi TaxID=28760 RepID=A0AAV9RK55_9TELE
MDLADEPQASPMDLFTFLSQEAEKTLRRFAGLSVPQSAYDGSRSPSSPFSACSPGCALWSGSEVLAAAPAHATKGPADASAPCLPGFSGKLVLVLASEPRDEVFEDEALSDPVPEGFKEQFLLVLASEARDEGSPGAASASEGSPGSSSASEGSPSPA